MRPAFHRRRAGFVLPLALFVLALGAMLAALLLEGAVQELRMARGDVAVARAQAGAGTALAAFLASAADSATLARPRGTIVASVAGAGAETTTVTVQSLGNGVLRVIAGTRVWSGMQRGDAANVGFVRITRDSAGAPGSLHYVRLPGWWWAQVP
ncbi:MAG TPA: hypothetical protein VGQ30_09780 [Gemmatimonadaceae bacterium]|nr:hypothetical protein [Gemmatimonadaceae bacterium]